MPSAYGGGVATTVFSIQAYIGLALSVAALGLEVYAFVSAARAPKVAFPAVGRLTKTVWLLILGVAALLTFYSLSSPTSLLSLLGAAAAIYFLVDVRPKVRGVAPDRSGRDGPYSGW